MSETQAAVIAIERVRVQEVPQLLTLIDAAVPECSPETVWQLPHNWSRYFVAKRRGSSKLLAAGSLQPIDGHGLEIRGLVVARDSRSQGLATLIVRRLLEEANLRRARTMCVTRKPAFFRRLGFHETPPTWLTPQRMVGEESDLPRRVTLTHLSRREAR
jgi:N-acetylglutamate synthase-like GNAT family acetyltransferase